MASGLTKTYGSLEIFTGVDLAIDKGSQVVVLGLNGAGKTTLLRLLAGWRSPMPGSLEPGYGLKIGYFAQEHDTLDDDATVWENIRHAAPDAGSRTCGACSGAFMFSGAQLEQPAGTLSGGEKTRLSLAGLVSSAANVLLLDEPTNNLDPVSREQVLDALRSYTGAVVLVTHDPGAAAALDPQRVILLPDGTGTTGRRTTRSSSSSLSGEAGPVHFQHRLLRRPRRLPQDGQCGDRAGDQAGEGRSWRSGRSRRPRPTSTLRPDR